MALPSLTLDPDDPAFRGKTWEAVERALEERDQYIMAGYEVTHTESRGPSVIEPCKPQYSTFPWEERISPFAKPASCTLDNWKHTCLTCTLGRQTATLQFDNGATNNALDPAMLDALQDAIMDLQRRSEVRVVILRSKGKLFSTGFDPKYLLSESSLSTEQITEVQVQFAKILYFFERLPQVTVALVQGSVMGAAVGLVCTCDMVYSVKGAFFAVREAKLGAVATTSIPYITRRITFIKNAQQLLLLAESISAETAKEYGIVTEVVEDVAGLEAECRKLCDNVTVCAPGAVAATKEVVTNTLGVPPSSFMLDYVASVLGEVRRGPEARGGNEAIQVKRRPRWAEVPIVA